MFVRFWECIRLAIACDATLFFDRRCVTGMARSIFLSLAVISKMWIVAGGTLRLYSTCYCFGLEVKSTHKIHSCLFRAETDGFRPIGLSWVV